MRFDAMSRMRRRTRHTLRLGDQAARVALCLRRCRRAAQHARDFDNALVGIERARVGDGAALVVALLDREVVIAVRRDLRQMGDAEQLAVRGQRLQPRATQ